MINILEEREYETEIIYNIYNNNYNNNYNMANKAEYYLQSIYTTRIIDYLLIRKRRCLYNWFYDCRWIFCVQIFRFLEKENRINYKYKNFIDLWCQDIYLRHGELRNSITLREWKSKKDSIKWEHLLTTKISSISQRKKGRKRKRFFFFANYFLPYF